MATRRDVLRQLTLTSAAGLGSSSIASGLARAAAPLSGQQATGFYRTRVGDYEVTILNDGARTFPLPDQFVRNVDKAQVLAATDAAYMPAGKVTVPFNPTLINTGKALILIDTGNGPSADGAVGHLVPNLKAAGVAPEDIDVVLISHLHPDHINGLTQRGGGLTFPKAAIKVPDADWSFWMSDANRAQAADPVTQNYFTNARKTLDPIADRVERYRWAQELAPGITALAAPGHTPGHTAFALASGTDRLFIQSDVTNIPELFLRHPDWHVMYDYDADQAQATRHRFYDMAAGEKATVIGYHFSFPSLGHVERDGSAYRLIPTAWNPAL